MAKYVHEIMNREVLMLRADEKAEDALGFLIALGVSGAPVVDATEKPIGAVSWRDLVEAPRGARIGERMTSPAVVVRASDSIEHAADVLAERELHRVFAVDHGGALAGALSIVDVLRGLTGKAVRHPAGFPHLDAATHLAWTDDEPLDLSAVDAAPDGPGVLLIIESLAGEADSVALVEAPPNVRTRVIELLSASQSERPDIARLLTHPSRLRFRAAAIGDARKRSAVARTFRAHAASALRAAVLR